MSIPPTRVSLLRTETFDPRPWVERVAMYRGHGYRVPEHGPWEDEPDLAEWLDSATGWPCMAKRGFGSNWCGYVCVPRSSKLWRVSYEVPIDGDGNTIQDLVSVHGGLTFADQWLAEGDWWFGFDCGHAWDTQPGLPPIIPDTVYRTLDYVIEQVTLMALQLRVIEGR